MNDSGSGDLGRYSQARVSSCPTSNTVGTSTRRNRTPFSRLRLLCAPVSHNVGRPLATNHAHRSTSRTDRRSTVGGTCRAHLSRGVRLIEHARERGRSLCERLWRSHSGVRNRQFGVRDFRLRRQHRTSWLCPTPMGNRAAVRIGVAASRNPAHLRRSAVARQRYRSSAHVPSAHRRGAGQRRSSLAWRLGEQSAGNGFLSEVWLRHGRTSCLSTWR